MNKIAISILSADFSCLAEEIKKVEEADLLHLDVMDGHFVPNITMGPQVVKSLRNKTVLPLDVHLMIENPGEYITQFVQAGSDILTVHQETCPNLSEIVQKIKKHRIKVGVALNPSTPLSKIENILEEVDMVLLMTVNPGFGGQKFISAVLPKIKELKELLSKKKLNIDIEVDGGIDKETALKVVKAGANVLVVGSAIFQQKNPPKALREIRNILVREN